jgi:hypothetical protein
VLRLVSWLWCVLAVSFVLVVGCAQVTEEPTPTTAPLELVVQGFDVEWARVAVEGAQVCESGTTNCVLTNANGGAVLRLPIGEETIITFEKDGYGKYLEAEVMPASGKRYTFSMHTNEHLAAQYKRVMSSYPMVGVGSILLFLNPSPLEGGTFELVDATGDPFYFDEEGNWSRELTETTSWDMRGMTGGFVEVPPGPEFRVKVGGSAQRCVPTYGWPADDENSMRLPVRAGYITSAGWICAQP